MSVDPENPTEFNRAAWDNIATSKHRWFQPVDQVTLEKARKGEFSIRLTATKHVPTRWIQDVKGKRVLCLAAGGGHQGPVLAAAGALVTVYDFSAEQLAIDRQVAHENDLDLLTVQGDMADLSAFSEQEFDLVVNPASVNFVPDVIPIWKEAYRVLRTGGRLMAGLIDPVNYLFDQVEMEKKRFVVSHRIPYSDLHLPTDLRDETLGQERPIEFGHTLSDLVGGQLAAGFALVDFFQDRWGGGDPLSKRIDVFMCTLAAKYS